MLFLAIRMIVYFFAVPVAAYLGGSYDAQTHVLTIDLDNVVSLIGGLGVASATFVAGRIAKARGGAT